MNDIMNSLLEERKNLLEQLRQYDTQDNQVNETTFNNKVTRRSLDAAVHEQSTSWENVGEENVGEENSSEAKLEKDLAELKKRTDNNLKRMLRERVLREVAQETQGA